MINGIWEALTNKIDIEEYQNVFIAIYQNLENQSQPFITCEVHSVKHYWQH